MYDVLMSLVSPVKKGTEESGLTRYTNTKGFVGKVKQVKLANITLKRCTAMVDVLKVVKETYEMEQAEYFKKLEGQLLVIYNWIRDLAQLKVAIGLHPEFATEVIEEEQKFIEEYAAKIEVAKEEKKKAAEEKKKATANKTTASKTTTAAKKPAAAAKPTKTAAKK